MVCSQQLLTALKKPQANHASDPCDQIKGFFSSHWTVAFESGRLSQGRVMECVMADKELASESEYVWLGYSIKLKLNL